VIPTRSFIWGSAALAAFIWLGFTAHVFNLEHCSQVKVAGRITYCSPPASGICKSAGEGESRAQSPDNVASNLAAPWSCRRPPQQINLGFFSSADETRLRAQITGVRARSPDRADPKGQQKQAQPRVFDDLNPDTRPGLRFCGCQLQSQVEDVSVTGCTSSSNCGRIGLGQINSRGSRGGFGVLLPRHGGSPQLQVLHEPIQPHLRCKLPSDSGRRRADNLPHGAHC
jgi:hypothetical protein